ncbi:MAG: insecticidal toxin complex protein [Balneolaceae bacterium]|nr:insecticidal toxin complex protein [Balneolaceae bacterium]
MQFHKSEDGTNVPDSLHEKNRKNGKALFTNKYLKRLRYGNHTPYYADSDTPYNPQDPVDSNCFFELVFDYGEHDVDTPTPAEVNSWDYRNDPFSSYRAGFEIRSRRLCKRILMFHHFEEEKQFQGTTDEEDFGKDYLVKSLDLEYKSSSVNGKGDCEATYLISATQSGYVRKPDGSYSKKSLPPMEYEYQEVEWNNEVKKVDEENIVNAPVGLTNNYQWVDLYKEGISGILKEEEGEWFYKSNYGDVAEAGELTFTTGRKIGERPSISGISSGEVSLQDLEGNGQRQAVINSAGMKGYFELDADGGWDPFRAFETEVNSGNRNPHSRMIDLNGDGRADLMVSEDQVFLWYASDGKKGYKPAEMVARPFDEEEGPAVVFADQEETIFLADMSGDGLTDIVRIRNGEICYWANKGYGRFSAKITMSNAPVFDHIDQFDSSYIHLADVSGTGATDVLYLSDAGFRAYLNLSGNAWSEAHELSSSFPVNNNNRLSVVDLFGGGTSCVVWSSDLPEHSRAPMKYIDLMGGQKPHLLTGYKNNLGKETSIEYKSSTHFYLKDKLNGTPWITKLPFPVQVVSKMIVEEKVTDVRFTSEYRYHHGHYDHTEKEFRGFGMVEQIDSEDYDIFAESDPDAQTTDPDLFQSPVLIRSWFHTGVYIEWDQILRHFEKEYWIEAYNREFEDEPIAVTEPALPDAILRAADDIQSGSAIEGLSGEEYREALRACKGKALRQEVFILDAEEGASSEELKKQMKPVQVTANSYDIQLLQPRAANSYGAHLVSEKEAMSIEYDRDEEDPRIKHTLNTRIDELGNILESATVVYPRQKVDNSLPDYAKAEQAKTLITCEQTTFCLAHGGAGQDVDIPSAYRLRMPFEVTTYEITGLDAAGDMFSSSDFTDILGDGSSEIAYHQQADENQVQRRLIEKVRTQYLDGDLSPLPFGEFDALGFSYKNYQLACTPSLIQDVYGAKINDIAQAGSDGNYLDLDADGNWWISSGCSVYVAAGEDADDARDRFFLPVAFENPLGHSTEVGYYKKYFLLLETVTDPLNNETQVLQFNFRNLSPQKIQDPNNNESAVLFDELGKPKATALIGKAGNVLNNLDGLKEWEDTAEQTLIDEYFSTPESNVLHNKAAQLLNKASTRLLYNYERYQVDGNPVVTSTVLREEHHSENANSSLNCNFEYTDGLGNVALTKVQAEAGVAEKVDEDGEVVSEDTSAFDPPALRWIGTGRKVLNNKGKPVKEYEPYFGVEPFFENEQELVQRGYSSIKKYDPLGRLIRETMPDETFTAKEYHPWKQTFSDQNDTVEDSSWYTNRINRSIDAELQAAGLDPEKEKTAAEKAAIHNATPLVLHFDTLGRPIVSIAHNKDKNGSNEFMVTTIELDIEGNVSSVVDARDNQVMAYKYDMLGHRVYQNSMDAGQRWSLENAIGKMIKAWDERDHEFTTTYDALNRPLEKTVSGGDGDVALNHVFEKIEYGESRANPEQSNSRGNVYRHYDTAGRVEFETYNEQGKNTKQSRTFASEYKEAVSWEGNLEALLEADTFTVEKEFNALGKQVQETAPDGSITTYTYNAGTLLEKVEVSRDGHISIFVKNISYNAKRQRLLIEYGNDTETQYNYDPKTYRLIQLQTEESGGGKTFQDLHYTYDPVGNISEIEDRAIPTVFFDNVQVQPKSEFEYDALYRLIEAKGKEHAGQNAPGQKDNWDDQWCSKQLAQGDALAWRNYTQTYQYDPVGNMEEMRHQANAANWTRAFTYENTTNRLTETSVGGDNYQYSYHNAHGFINELPHLEVMEWRFRDRLKKVARQKVNAGTPETTYYVYDAEGQRVRKVTERASDDGNASRKEERYYVGQFEKYKSYTAANDLDIERDTLHISDDNGRIAMIDQRVQGVDDYAKTTIRYQYSNHLQTAALEVDENGRVISYEEYHPFGTTSYQAMDKDLKATAKRYRYTGKERDNESGLYYHGARYYLCWLARWAKPDPLGIADGINLTAYVSNNPMKLHDPTGNYGEAGHFYTIYFVSLAAGFDADTAFKNAFYAQLPDEIGELDAVTAQARAAFKQSISDEERDEVQTFLHSLTGTQATKERTRTKKALSSFEPGSIGFGFLMHRFGDTYAHSKSSGKTYPTGIGHGLAGHKPDEIFRRPGLYKEYVLDLYDTLSKRAAAEGESPRLSRAQVEQYADQIGAIKVTKTTSRTYHGKYTSRTVTKTTVDEAATEAKEIQTIRNLSQSMMGETMKSFAPENDSYSIGDSITWGWTNWQDYTSMYGSTHLKGVGIGDINKAFKAVGEALYPNQSASSNPLKYPEPSIKEKIESEINTGLNQLEWCIMNGGRGCFY